MMGATYCSDEPYMIYRVRPRHFFKPYMVLLCMSLCVLSWLRQRCNYYYYYVYHHYYCRCYYYYYYSIFIIITIFFIIIIATSLEALPVGQRSLDQRGWHQGWQPGPGQEHWGQTGMPAAAGWGPTAETAGRR